MPSALAADAINLAAGASERSALVATTTDAVIALIIVVGSILTAWCLNYRAPAVRVFGTLLAASGCLFVAAWFFIFVSGTGIMESPKPYQTPMDSAKPMLLWLQAGLALLVGLALLLVAYYQAQGNDAVLALAVGNESARYGQVSRMLHWTTAILFIAMIPMGIFASMIPEDTPYRLGYYAVHKTIGVLVFGL